jgi:membrane associated rhomboid family serine protease
MGIYDRDYVRKSGPSFLGSFMDRGTICKWLIGINVVVFFIQLFTREGRAEPFTDGLLLNVDQVIFHGQVWRLLTYAFLHDTGDLLHILFNMLFLYWFGRDMEDLYGPREFLAFYLVSAVVGGVAFSALHLLGVSGNLCLGASGAVTAVLVLTAFHYPRRIIYLMFFLPVPIWLFVVGAVAYDAYTALADPNSKVAVTVHLGGAAFAFLYYRLHWRIDGLLEGLLPSVRYWRKRAARPQLRIHGEPPPQPVASAVASSAEEDRIKAEMDAVLEKISRVGRDNLTADELDVLQRASEILRRRRP